MWLTNSIIRIHTHISTTPRNCPLRIESPHDAHMSRTRCVYIKYVTHELDHPNTRTHVNHTEYFSNFTHELTHICHKRYVYTCNATHELDHPSTRTHVNHTQYSSAENLISLTNSRTYVTNDMCIRVMRLTNSIIRAHAHMSITPHTFWLWLESHSRREVGGWGRDPKKCTGRDWGMGSSTI